MPTNQPEVRSGTDDSAPPLEVGSAHKSPYLVFRQIGTRWHGRRSLTNLVIFGDSYSSKLGGPSWGTDEDDGGEDTTWADLFASCVTSHASPSAVAAFDNFAFPGATVEHDLAGQLDRFFLDRSPNESRLGPERATYVLFLGINDCGRFPGKDLSLLVKVLFDAVRRLYVDAAARNFILVDVPPTDRSPAVAMLTTVDVAGRIREWNAALLAYASEFVSHSDPSLTMLVFSAHKVLSEVLDDPVAYGFAARARFVVGGGIWRDGLHLTRAVHEIIASRLSSALGT